MKNESGFSLLEIMIVVIIIGLLAAVVGQNFVGQADRAKVTACKQDLASIANALDAYEADNGGYPNSYQSLRALIQNPDEFAPDPQFIAKNWRGPYLRKKVFPILDPWQHSYNYECPGIKDPNSFDLWSYGKDGQEGGEKLNADIFYGYDEENPEGNIN